MSPPLRLLSFLVNLDWKRNPRDKKQETNPHAQRLQEGGGRADPHAQSLQEGRAASPAGRRAGQRAASSKAGHGATCSCAAGPRRAPRAAPGGASRGAGPEASRKGCRRLLALQWPGRLCAPGSSCTGAWRRSGPS